MEQDRDSALPHFRDYWFIIVKRKKILIISIILSILFGFLNTKKGAPTYLARAKIMIATGEAILPSGGNKMAGMYLENQDTAEKYSNEYEFMRSYVVADKTAKMLGLTDKDAVKYIRGAITIDPVLTGYVITNIAFVIATDTDPKKAMDIANYTIRAYLEAKEDGVRGKIRKTYEVYTQQIQELKDKIRKAELLFEEHKKKHNLEGMENELEKHQAELLKLLNVYTEKHPLVLAKRAQIEELNSRLMGDVSHNDAASDKPQDSDIGKTKSEYYALQQEILTNKEMYNYLMVNIKELNVSQELSKLEQVKVLEWAALPTVSEQKKNIVLFFSPFLGLILGVGLIFFLEYMDNTIKTDQDIKQYVGLSTLGVIQHIEEDR